MFDGRRAFEPDRRLVFVLENGFNLASPTVGLNAILGCATHMPPLVEPADDVWRDLGKAQTIGVEMAVDTSPICSASVQPRSYAHPEV